VNTLAIDLGGVVTTMDRGAGDSRTVKI